MSQTCRRQGVLFLDKTLYITRSIDNAPLWQAFTVDIGASVLALLPRLSFEGATRRNAPNLQVGALVYARVVKSHRDINPELSCMDVT
ncbi:unnamed protein product [Calypogeia fissa]